MQLYQHALAANGQRLQTKGGIIAHLHGCVKGIHVNVDNASIEASFCREVPQ